LARKRKRRIRSMRANVWPEPPKRKERSRKPQEPDLPDRQKNRFRLPEEPPADIHVPWKPSYKEKVEDVKKKEADNEEA
jgi:hypothetical protein